MTILRKEVATQKATSHEKLRYESGIKLNAVPFTDTDGKEHTYGVSNTLTHFIGVWLKERNPRLDIEVKSSRFDEEEEC